MNENFNNSRTSDDIDMKLGPVTILDKENTRTLKKIDDNVMPENCDVIVSGTLLKPDSGRMVCKTYIFINSDILSYNRAG